MTPPCRAYPAAVAHIANECAHACWARVVMYVDHRLRHRVGEQTQNWLTFTVLVGARSFQGTFLPFQVAWDRVSYHVVQTQELAYKSTELILRLRI